MDVARQYPELVSAIRERRVAMSASVSFGRHQQCSCGRKGLFFRFRHRVGKGVEFICNAGKKFLSGLRSPKEGACDSRDDGGLNGGDLDRRQGHSPLGDR